METSKTTSRNVPRKSGLTLRVKPSAKPTPAFVEGRCKALTNRRRQCKNAPLAGQDVCWTHGAKPVVKEPPPKKNTVLVTYYSERVSSFLIDDLTAVTEVFLDSKLIDISFSNEAHASLVVAKTHHTDLVSTLTELDWDKKYYAYGSVKNRRAKYTLLFADEAQEPDYACDLCRIVPWSSVKQLEEVKDHIESAMHDFKVATTTGDYYYNSKCGVNLRGLRADGSCVILCCGDPITLKFQWHLKTETKDTPKEVKLEDGDFLFFSDKAMGKDWIFSPDEYTLRHSINK